MGSVVKSLVIATMDLIDSSMLYNSIHRPIYGIITLRRSRALKKVLRTFFFTLTLRLIRNHAQYMTSLNLNPSPTHSTHQSIQHGCTVVGIHQAGPWRVRYYDNIVTHHLCIASIKPPAPVSNATRADLRARWSRGIHVVRNKY